MQTFARVLPILLAYIVVSTSFAEAQENDTKSTPLVDMSLSQLMLLQVSEAGSMTQTSEAKAPAAVTRITQQDIKALGARSMLELLEMTVPGLQMIRHNYEVPHLGIRGITSDREDKVMIRVNGRVMNERTGRGAVTERDFPLMGDIKKIDVIRGAGSSMYGLGAVSMVIDIQTYDSTTLPENSVSVRGGAGMIYKSADINIAHILDNGLGIYFNSELVDMKGANDEDAPLIFGAEGVSLNTGETIPRGEAMPTQSRDWAGYQGHPYIKLHLGLDYEENRFWVRYTKSGHAEAAPLIALVEPPLGLEKANGVEPLGGMEYEQFTATFDQSHPIMEDIVLNWMLSFDQTEVTKLAPYPGDNIERHYAESEVFGRSVINWAATANSDVALGVEFSHEEFGLHFEQSSRGRWNTYTASFLSEWQWRPTDDWTLFLGGRVDKHTYTKTLFSPRASVIYSADDINIYKLLLTQSRRMNIAQANRNAELKGNTEGETEVLNSLEWRYERVTDNVISGLSLFYIDLDALGWDQVAENSIIIGNQTQWGLEAEQTLTYGDHHIGWSLAYTQLIDFDLYGKSTYITAKPWGFGNDLADWATYSTKVRYTYDISDQTKLITTLRAFWGYDGSQDYLDKRISDGQTIVTSDWDDAYKEQVYLNMGIRHEIVPDATLSFDVHNVLGAFDKDLNKRIYRDSLGSYRSEAVAVSAGLSYKF